MNQSSTPPMTTPASEERDAEDTVTAMVEWTNAGLEVKARNDAIFSALLKHARDLAAALAAANERERWIPCGERLPASPGDQLVAIPGNPVASIWKFNIWADNRCYWESYSPSYGYVSIGDAVSQGWCWRPLPEPPKGNP